MGQLKPQRATVTLPGSSGAATIEFDGLIQSGIPKGQSQDSHLSVAIHCCVVERRVVIAAEGIHEGSGGQQEVGQFRMAMVAGLV